MSSKRKKSGTLPSKKVLKAYKQVEPVMRPLVELFAVVDDVMTEHDAFDDKQIKKSLGRIYREWRDNTRPALDSEFDRERYRHEMKGHRKKKGTPLGKERLASGSLTRSTDQKQTSDKSQSESARGESASAKRSAKDVRSDAPVSSGRSKKKNRSVSGEASRSGRGKDSASGSKKKGTPGSQKTKD